MKNTQSLYGGFLIFIAGFILLLGITTSELFFPMNYSMRENTISRLSRVDGVLRNTLQAGPTIFNVSMSFAGILILIASYLLRTTLQKKFVFFLLMILGISLFGLGLFPGSIPSWHYFFSASVFLSGQFFIFFLFLILPPPLKYFYAFIGFFSFVSNFTHTFTYPIFGSGGLERLACYPLMLCLVGFGSYIVGRNEKEEEINMQNIRRYTGNKHKRPKVLDQVARGKTRH